MEIYRGVDVSDFSLKLNTYSGMHCIDEDGFMNHCSIFLIAPTGHYNNHTVW